MMLIRGLKSNAHNIGVNMKHCNHYTIYGDCYHSPRCKGIPVQEESLEDMVVRIQQEEAAQEIGIDVEDLPE